MDESTIDDHLLKDQSPESEIAVQGNDKEITFSDGRTVPTDLVRVLNSYDENIWPGAVKPEARASVAYAVMSAIPKDSAEVPKTSYKFCLAPDPVEVGGCPCVLPYAHLASTKHKNNNDETWS